MSSNVGVTGRIFNSTVMGLPGKISVFSALKYILVFITREGEVFTNIRMPCLLPFFHQVGTVDARHLDAISKQGQNQQGRGGFPLYDRIPITNFEP